MTFFILLALAGFLDGLNDDWHDRPNAKSRAYRFFSWLSMNLGLTRLFKWYFGTHSGLPPVRFLKICYDYWHTVKIIKKLLTFVFIPLSLFILVDGSWTAAVTFAILGYGWEAGSFLLSYHVILDAGE